MSPQPSIAHYSIIAKLGEGGMGVVYRATDSKLGREVAIKIIPEKFAQDPSRMARFQREAQVLASLNHPNIATLYGVEEERALIMELVEGATLAERIAQGPIPLDEALPIARQIAEALEAAHEKGIVHRDLKPANVKLTPGGVVKVLDFGLAKTLLEDSRMSRAASPVTRTMHSEEGAILGTTAYMSPEQATGKIVDRRTDVWAFGVLLYEMLAGVPPFCGASQSEVVAAVLKEEPDWRQSPAQVQPLLRRCLEKDPKRRLRSIADGLLLLEDFSAPPAAAPPARTAWIAWAALALTSSALAAWGWLRSTPPPPRPVSRWTTSVVALDPGNGFGIAVSRDGTQLAYIEQAGGSSRIVVRRLDQSESKPVPGSDGAIRPVFSPDGRWLAYFSGIGGPIKKIAVTGGVPITLCEDASYYGASWGDDDRIVFSGGSGTLLKQVPASGGKCEVISSADSQNGETARRWPQILPGGASILATISSGSSYDSARIAVIDRSNGKARVIVTGGSAPRYASSGHLLYVRGATLYAVPFDLKGLSVAGPETPVVEGVYYNPSGGFADYAVSDSGMLLYFRETRANILPTLDWVEQNGISRHSALPPGRYAEVHMSSNASNIRLSPDGRRAAVSMTSGAGSIDIWIADLERGTLARLTSEGVNYQPVWTPDGKRVAFSSLGGRTRGIYWVPADGSGKLELLLPGNYIYPDAWTPDGKTLLYESSGPARLWAFTLPSAGGNGKPGILSGQITFEESGAQLSPDGRWMAYTSDESGRSQVYVRPFPGPGGRDAISVEAGANPRWSANGKEIFYFDPVRNQVMVVAVEGGATLRPKQPQPLFEQRTADWDVTPDGKRFLVRRVPQTEQSQSKIEAVVNWFEELTRKVPRAR